MGIQLMRKNDTEDKGVDDNFLVEKSYQFENKRYFNV